MESPSNSLISMVDPGNAEALRRSLDTDVASFEEMATAANLLTKMMERLMRLREGILVKMRKTGMIR